MNNRYLTRKELVGLFLHKEEVASRIPEYIVKVSRKYQKLEKWTHWYRPVVKDEPHQNLLGSVALGV